MAGCLSARVATRGYDDLYGAFEHDVPVTVPPSNRFGADELASRLGEGAASASIVSSGCRIDPDEVEDAVAAHGSVAAAGVSSGTVPARAGTVSRDPERHRADT